MKRYTYRSVLAALGYYGAGSDSLLFIQGQEIPLGVIGPARLTVAIGPLNAASVAISWDHSADNITFDPVPDGVFPTLDQDSALQTFDVDMTKLKKFFRFKYTISGEGGGGCYFGIVADYDASYPPA